MTVPLVPENWYYARMQAIGRAQSRYLLTLLVIAAYTLALRFTSGGTASVPFLGLSVPKTIVNAWAVIVLEVLLLALYGAFRAAKQTLEELQRQRGPDGAELKMYQLDEHPNVADFLGYAMEGHRAGFLILYPIPVLAVAVWTVLLWLRSMDNWPLASGSLKAVLIIGGVLVIGVVAFIVPYMAKRVNEFRKAGEGAPPVTPTPGQAVSKGLE